MVKYKIRPSEVGRSILRRQERIDAVKSEGGYRKISTGKLNGFGMYIYEDEVCLEVPSPRVSSFYVPGRKRSSNYMITGGPSYFVLKGHEGEFAEHIVGGIHRELEVKFKDKVAKNSVVISMSRYMDKRGYPEYLQDIFLDKIRALDVKRLKIGNTVA